eukprot:4076755-Pleurochrysis_carterae.AAC.3
MQMYACATGVDVRAHEESHVHMRGCVRIFTRAVQHCRQRCSMLERCSNAAAKTCTRRLQRHA